MPDKNSERHVMDIFTAYLKEKEGLNLNKGVWLAIYNYLEAGFYTISNGATQFSYRCGFDRIFWIEMVGGNPVSLHDPILPAIKENMPKSRTDVFKVYKLRIENEN